jgi:hypothetical protein
MRVQDLGIKNGLEWIEKAHLSNKQMSLSWWIHLGVSQ